MTTNGMTAIEKDFMQSLIRNSKKIADALDRLAAAQEEANYLKRRELHLHTAAGPDYEDPNDGEE